MDGLVANILVTGASGHLASHLIPLLAKSHRIVSMSRQRTRSSTSSVKGEFHSPKDLRRLDRLEIDVLVHLAAETGFCTQEAAFSVNVLGTARLLRHLLDRGCRKFVLASSIAAVGALDDNFIPLALPIKDDHPCLARDPYGQSKAFMEDLARYFHRSTPDADFTVLRLGSVVPQRSGWVPPPARAGQPLKLPFIELASIVLVDALDALQRAVEVPSSAGTEVFNIVGPEAHSDDPVPHLLRTLFGPAIASVDLSWYERVGHELDPVYDIGAAEVRLGFRPQNRVRDLLESHGGSN